MCGTADEYADDRDFAEQIEREIGIPIQHEPSGNEEKRKFTEKTHDELIELLLAAQVTLSVSRLLFSNGST